MTRSSHHPWKPKVEGTAKQGQGRGISVSNHLRLNLALVRKPQTRGCGKLLLRRGLHQKFQSNKVRRELRQQRRAGGLHFKWPEAGGQKEMRQKWRLGNLSMEEILAFGPETSK